MNEQQTSCVMAKWARIFREEGDAETADAIESQLENDARARLSEEDAAWLQRVLAAARQREANGQYAQAADRYTEALRIVESALGACHPDTFEHLSDVARCQFNAGQYDAALEYYGRLLRLVEERFGPEHALSAVAKNYMRNCRRGIRDIAGTLRLGGYMNDMLRRSQSMRLVEVAARADRMRELGRRLTVRGRRDAAIRLHTAAIALRLSYADPDSETAYLEIHRHAIDLKEAGDPGKAARALNNLAAMRNRNSVRSDQRLDLRSVLHDSVSCHCAHGHWRSAQQGAALVQSMTIDHDRKDAC